MPGATTNPSKRRRTANPPSEMRPSLHERSDGRHVDIICPSDGKAFAQIARGTAADIDAAVKAVRAAFEKGAWGKLTAVERARTLTKLGQKVLDHFEDLAGLEARDTGKPMKQARAHITATARYFDFYGAAADTVHGDVISFLEGDMVTALREAKGVTGPFIPWNYPAHMFGCSRAPALAMGNATVIKPPPGRRVPPCYVARKWPWRWAFPMGPSIW